MSSPQEYQYTAYPTMSQCQGTSCYCFEGKNQLDASISDSETEDETIVPSLSAWHVNNGSDWIVYLNQLTFRHPRVLLAYFRYVGVTNELAETLEEYIRLPCMPKDVRDYILNHISFKEDIPEFREERNELSLWVERLY